MDSASLRRKAAYCRQLADTATTREIREALGALARELEEEAAAMERNEQGNGGNDDPAGC
jgi:hypothetical protein